MKQPTQAQQTAIEKVKTQYRGKKAYIILAEMYDEAENPMQYEVHYNTTQPLALDYRIFRVAEGQDANDIRNSAKIAMNELLNEIMFVMCDSEAIVKYISILQDGDIA